MIFRKIKLTHFRILAILVAASLALQVSFCGVWNMQSYAQTGTVNTDRLNLRSGPGTNYSSVRMLSTNTKVSILNSVTGSDGRTWYQVSTSYGDGYLRSDFVNLSVTYQASDLDFESYLSSHGFPESYKNDLRGLHQKYPNWVFVAQKTGLDWNTAVAEESKIGRNLVYTTQPSSWKSTEDGGFDWAGNYWPGYDGSTWVAASKEIISHYMDPRNFLTDPYIFQFQQQTYDPSVQNKEGLLEMVKGTFLEKAVGSVSGGTSAAGPGYSQNSTNSTGPGVSGSTVNSSVSSDNSSIQFVGPVASVENALFSLFGGITSYAAWEKENGQWIWLNDDGSRNVDGWFWLDGNKDGIYECYYFDQNGIMASDTTIDGYTVNKDGQWVQNGVIQTKGTANASGTSTGQTTYADLIMEAAKQSKVSPYVLAAMIIQEQGTNGNSPLISGTNSQYYGYYNFYNIGAYEHDGMSAVQAGLKYASESGNGNRPWNTVEKGIVGGAIAYGANFVDCGQDTFYLKKFNVQGRSPYTHQFMTNVIAAAQEGSKISSAYSDSIKNSALVFRIPIYENMPETPCELPTKTGNPNNKLSQLSVDGFQITPTFHMNTETYSLIIDSSVPGININASAIDSKAKISGTGYYQLGEGTSELVLQVTAENGDIRNYRLSVTKRSGGAVSDGTYGNGSSSYGPGTVNSGDIFVTTPQSDSKSSTSSSNSESTIVIGEAPM